MTFILRFSIVVSCVCLAYYVARLVLKGKLQLSFSLLWIGLVALLTLSAIFPQPICLISDLLGFNAPSNFVFVVGFVCVIIILLSLSAIVSKQSDAIKNLTHTIALLENNLNRNSGDK